MKKQTQNKPNSRKAQMNVNFFLERDYENQPLRRLPENKPKQTQSQKSLDAGRYRVYYEVPTKRGEWAKVAVIETTGQDMDLGIVPEQTGRVLTSLVPSDAGGIGECGFIGSNNSLGWAEKGVVGAVTNAGARDTDEIIKVKRIAVYCKDGYSTRGVRPGRLIAESYNFPINCGGALVFPGDLVIADGDGVLVVPRQRALEVGEIARQIHVGDEKSRAKRYQRLGIPLDETVAVE